MRAWLFVRMIRSAFYRFGDKSTFVLPIRLSGEQSISVGKRVTIGENSWLQALSTEKMGPVIEIGDGVSSAGFCTISAVESVVVGANVLLARYVYIADHAHSFSDIATPVSRQGICNISPVRIGDGAWLGQGVVVCPGVTIGRGAVIGANSVVRSDIPDFHVAAGSPARVIRPVDEKRT